MATLGPHATYADVAEIISAGRQLSRGLRGPLETDGMSTPHILASVSSLFALMAQRNIDGIVVGGIAMLTYVDGRNTQDVDLILAAADLDRMPEIVVADRNDDFARGMFGQLRVDVLLTSNPVFDLVRRQYVRDHELSGRVVKVASVEGMILLKLFALPALYLQGHLDRVAIYEADLVQLFGRCDSDPARLLELLRPRLMVEQMAELTHIVADTQRRVARVKRPPR